MTTSRRNVVLAVLTIMTTVSVLSVAQPALALPGLVRVSAVSAVDSSATKTVRVPCPAGKRITGVGGTITGGGGQVSLIGYAPVIGGTDYGVAAAAEDATGYAGVWSLTAYAICVSPGPIFTVVTATSPTNSSPNKSMTVACPAGTKTIGIGGWITGGGGQVDLNDVYATVGLAGAGAIGFEVAGGFPGLWSVRTYAICTAIGGLVEVDVQVPGPSGDATTPKMASATCPSGTYVHSLGARIGLTLLHERITVVQPNAGLTGIDVKAYADEFGQPQPWNLTGIAICAP